MRLQQLRQNEMVSGQKRRPRSQQQSHAKNKARLDLDLLESKDNKTRKEFKEAQTKKQETRKHQMQETRKAVKVIGKLEMVNFNLACVQH